MTQVRAVDDDFVAGQSLAGGRSFSTGGIDCARAALPAACNDAAFSVGPNNPHGTAVVVPVNAEVTASDVLPENDCPAALTTCFGHGSRLSIANGAVISGGILVTMRWDETDLLNGVTPSKLNVIHLFDPGKVFNGKSYALITDLCTSQTQTHCFVVEPFKLGDRDIQATFRLRTTAYRKAGGEVSQESSERRRPALTTSPLRS